MNSEEKGSVLVSSITTCLESDPSFSVQGGSHFVCTEKILISMYVYRVFRHQDAPVTASLCIKPKDSS